VVSVRTRSVVRVFLLAIAMLLIAGYIVLHNQDYSRIKRLIEQTVADASGRRLIIHGELALSLSLAPELAVKNVTLANAGWGSKPQMASIGLLRLRISLLPLLKGELKFRNIHLVDMQVLLETDATGRGNWQFTPSDTARAGPAITRLGIKRLGVDRLAVTFRSEGARATEEHYTLDRFELGNAPDRQSLAVELEGETNGQALSLTGTTGALHELFSASPFPLALSGEIAGARLSINGSINNPMTLAGIALEVQASGGDLRPVGVALRTDFPETRNFEVQAKLAGSPDNMSVRQLKGRFDTAGIQLAVTGSIDNLAGLGGLHFQVNGSGDDLAKLGPALDLPLPSSGPFSVSGNVQGTASSLALSNAQGTINRPNLKLSLAGSIGDLLNLKGIDLRVDGSGSDLALVGPVVGQTLPHTDAFRLQGKLTGSEKALTLSEAQGTVGREDVKLSLTGRVRDLQALKGIDLIWKSSGKSLAGLNGLLDATLPRTGAFTATGRLSGSTGKLSVTSLDGNVRQRQAMLKVTGRIDDLQQVDGIDLAFTSTGKDFAELGSLFDARLPDFGPFSLSGTLLGSRSRLEIKSFSAKIDNSDFNGWSTISFARKPEITVKLQSGLIDFTRIMDLLKDASHENTPAAGPLKQTRFSQAPLPFAMLDAVNADISLDARNIKARDAALEFGRMAMRINDGQMQMDTLEAVYKKTRLSANLAIRGQVPARVATRFLVQGFALGEFLRETGIMNDVEVNADIAADLQSLGQSPRSLVTNLDGVFAVVIGKGKMPRFLDLLAEDLSRRLIPIWGSHKEAGNLNCGVVQFGIQHGVATSDAFLFDTRLGYLKGKGSINLTSEQINFLLAPHPRRASLFSLKTKVRIGGSVSDPTVRPDTRSLALKGSKAMSALVIGPVGLLAPFVNQGARKSHPCDLQSLRDKLEQIYQ
jgi:uncharacterized protein involved in outer membrane biogenesis